MKHYIVYFHLANGDLEKAIFEGDDHLQVGHNVAVAEGFIEGEESYINTNYVVRYRVNEVSQEEVYESQQEINSSNPENLF